MRRFLGRSQTRNNDESGFTLAELTVAITLTVLLSLAAFATVDSFSSATEATQQRLTNTSQSQLILDRISKDMRSATATGAPVLATDPPAAVQYADPNHIIFYASLPARSIPSSTTTTPIPVAAGQSGPVRFDIKLDTAGTLTETVTAAVPVTGSDGWASGWTWPTVPTSVVTTTGIDVTQGNLFGYYRAAVDPTAATSSPLVAAASDPGMTPATSPSSALIDTVTIDLWVRQSASTTAPSTELKSSIHLRNVDFSQTSN